MSSPPARANRLQLATRMHYVLMRELGQGIDIGKMLKRDDYARDVLLVCDAYGDAHELARLSRAFRSCPADLAPTAQTGPGWRESQFAASGFGATRPPGSGADAGANEAAPRTTWFDRLMP